MGSCSSNPLHGPDQRSRKFNYQTTLSEEEAYIKRTFRVTCAGIDEANGIYQQEESYFDHVPCYSRGRMLLLRYKLPGCQRQWYIADRHSLGVDDDDYYRIPSEDPLPPCHIEYMLAKDGIAPGPVVEMINEINTKEEAERLEAEKGLKGSISPRGILGDSPSSPRGEAPSRQKDWLQPSSPNIDSKSTRRYQVEGAGLPEVNGRYEPAGINNNFTYYAGNGNVIFHHTGVWYISPEQFLGTDQACLYRVESTDPFPPSNAAWQTMMDGEDPAPKVTVLKAREGSVLNDLSSRLEHQNKEREKAKLAELESLKQLTQGQVPSPS
eukprot:CAMPEP_0197866172 /NCGR_PEP_ID=MMETSP1438-20131217/44069_1 /TAXON_ID=1461541 /ORGANISM="Pterosperma sp., Strain CCMP1384" /LENGTH=323 /DNA_ID=CAMNT_0043484719 /DNA_START=634 /DNA_END=1605 /DNA_ORIENTATION=+